MTETYECPVCGATFKAFGSADHHYDEHKASEYILESWGVEDNE